MNEEQNETPRGISYLVDGSPYLSFSVPRDIDLDNILRARGDDVTKLLAAAVKGAKGEAIVALGQLSAAVQEKPGGCFIED